VELTNKDLLVLDSGDSNALTSLYIMAVLQLTLGREDDGYRNASRGLLLARSVGNEERIAGFDKLLPRFEEAEELADPTATAEEKRLREKIRVEKEEAKERAVAEAARAAAPQPSSTTTEDDLDKLMKEFGLEDEANAKKKKSRGGGNASAAAGGGGGSKKKKGKKGGK
jgi:hypothetical protein